MSVGGCSKLTIAHSEFGREGKKSAHATQTKMINRISDLPRTAKTFEKREGSPLACPGVKRARTWRVELSPWSKEVGRKHTLTHTTGPTRRPGLVLGMGMGPEPRIVCVAHQVPCTVPYQGRLGRTGVGPNRRTLTGRVSFGMGGGSRKGTNFGIQGPASRRTPAQHTRGKARCNAAISPFARLLSLMTTLR